MKRILASILIIAALMGLGAAATKAAELQPISFPFIGRWQPSEDPVLLDDYGLQDIQNLRKSGKHFKAIGGHTIINSTTLSASRKYVLNGFHFHKDQPAESHVIVLSGNADDPTFTSLSENTAVVPGTGNFSTTVLHQDPTSLGRVGRFSFAPAGNMVYANGPETVIWGGSEIEATAFITSETSLSGTSISLTNPNDYSDKVSNVQTAADQEAIIGGGIDSYTKFLLHSDGTDASTIFVDAISTTRTISAAGSAEIDTSEARFGTGSLILASASTDYIYSAGDTCFYPGTDYNVFDFWWRPNGTPSTTGFFQQYHDANNFYQFYYDANKLRLARADAGAPAEITSSALTVTANQWNHIAVMFKYDGAASPYSFWLNGVNVGYGTVNATMPSLTDNFQIGRIDALGVAYGINGSIDEFRISRGTDRYPHALGSTDFTPSIRAYGTAANTFLVGFTRPLQGVKLYVDRINRVASTLSCKEWNGVSWTSLSITDNTVTGGVSLAKTGTVTWSSTASTSKARYINGYSLYWYQFTLSEGEATIYYVTVDAPMQSIKNIWNGAEVYLSKCYKYDGTNYIDYTDAVNDNTYLTYLDASSLSTSGYLLVGFVQPMQGFDIQMVAGQENTTASTQMSGSYSDGSGWMNVIGINDGTATSTTSLNKSGIVSFQGQDTGTEFQRAISDETPLYYYKLNFATALDGTTQIAEIRGIPYPRSISSYSFSESFQNRLFLFSEYNGQKNKVIYSQENSPDILNGSDSGDLYIGGNDEIISAKAVYNVFGNSAYDQLIIGKRNEIYRLSGDGPDTWNVKRISANIGVIAPLSMVSCEVSGQQDTARTQVIIWQGDKGFYMTDGSFVISISDDIKCYFDPNDSRYIPTARRSKTVGWYDPYTRVYKALISSGSGQTYHNIELEYSLMNKEWAKVYRANASGADPLQCGFQVFDTSGIGYTYGGNRTGYMYRLENGTTFSGTTITQYLHTKDMILDQTAPLFRKSAVKYLRTAHKKKSGGTITVAHYGDQVLTVSGTSNQSVPGAFPMATAPYNTQSCALGPFLYHSFKFTTSDTTAADGMELIGLGFFVEPYTALR